MHMYALSVPVSTIAPLQDHVDDGPRILMDADNSRGTFLCENSWLMCAWMPHVEYAIREGVDDQGVVVVSSDFLRGHYIL